MKKPVDSTPVDMHERDCVIRYGEGLRVAISCAKEMQAMEPKNGWKKMEQLLLHLKDVGKKLAETKPMTRGELLQRADQIAKAFATDPKN